MDTLGGQYVVPRQPGSRSSWLPGRTAIYTILYIRSGREALKPVEWVGDSLKRVRAFAKPVRQQVGYELELVQHGLEPSDWKPMTTIGPGVN